MLVSWAQAGGHRGTELSESPSGHYAREVLKKQGKKQKNKLGFCALFLQGEKLCIKCTSPVHPGSSHVQQRPCIPATRVRELLLGSTICFL